MKKQSRKSYQYFVEPIGIWANEKIGDFVNCLRTVDEPMIGFHDETGFPHNAFPIPYTAIAQLNQSKKDIGIQFQIWYRSDQDHPFKRYNPGGKK